MDDSACDLLCLDLPKAERLRSQAPADDALARAAAAAKALADPTRLRIAIALREGDELCVCDIAWIVEQSDKVASHHARILRAAGLAESRRDGKMVMYSLTSRGRELVTAALPAEPARADSR
ncbi:MAG: helix-turn-helix transcriptional regulator [Actinobacteria bacterium]|nr:helix-turn-helix transcriptional regulator [Actinomycetota bacterium]